MSGQSLDGAWAAVFTGALGTRHPIAWFAEAKEQPPRAARPGMFYPSAIAHGPEVDQR